MGFVFNAGAPGGSVLATGSTTPRTSEDRWAGRKDIRDYGAVSGGSAASNTFAIQAAVNACYNTGGGRIYVPSGGFEVTSNTNTAAYPGAISLGAFDGIGEVGATPPHLYSWFDDYTYSNKHIVTSELGGETRWKSVQNGNLNHNPDTDLTNTWWTPVTGQEVPFGSVWIVIEGDGLGSYIYGNFPGFIFDRCQHSGGPMHITIRNLKLKNSHTTAGGCIRLLGVDGSSVEHCDIQAKIGVQIGSNGNGLLLPDGTGDVAPTETAGTSFISTVRNCTIVGITDSSLSGSVGVLMGMHAACIQNSIILFQRGVQGYGVGSTIMANRIEVNDAGVYLGRDAVGNPFPAKSYSVISNSFESNRDGIYIDSADTTLIAANTTQSAGNGPFPKNRSGIAIKHASETVVMSCVFGEQGGGGPLSKGSVWFLDDAGGRVTTFIATSWGTFLDENTHPNYKSKWRLISCAKNYPTLLRTYQTLPNAATADLIYGEKAFITDGQRLSGAGSGTTAVLGSIVQGGGTQDLEVMWNGTAWQCTIVV